MIGFYIIILVAVGVVSLSAVTDLRDRRIPNVITMPAMIAGLLFHTLAPIGQGWSFALAGWGLGAGLLVLPYLLGGGGMGDIKLLAALGSWLGPYWLLVAFACGILVGAVLTVICLVTGRSLEELIPFIGKQKSGSSQAKHSGNFTSRLRQRKGLPFAVPLALGMWIMMATLLIRGGF